MLYRILFLLCTCLTGAQMYAQTWGVTGAAAARFNADDFLMGFDVGVCQQEWRASLSLGTQMRVGSKRILLEVAPDEFDQYREKRYLLNLRAEKRFMISSLGETAELEAWVAADGAYSFGKYRGTSLKPYQGFLVSPGAGLDVCFSESVVLQAGYHYLPFQTSSISNHRILAGVRFLFF